MSLDVKFSAKDINFTDTVSKIKREIEEMDDDVKKTSNGVQASFGSMVKAGAALAIGFGAIKAVASAITGTLGTFKDALDLGGTMSDLSARTGETAGNLMILNRAFDNSGVGADKVGTSINKLQKFMDDAAQGSEKNNTVLSRLGLTMADLAGKTPTKQMEILANKLSSVGDNGEKSALAMSIFGKAGGQLLPFLTNFSGELQTARDQLGNMPGVLDRNANSFDAISDNINVAKGKFLEFAAGLLESIAPALELATTLLTRFDAAGAGMKLGEIITGASNAMGGFSDALNAIKLGEFGVAFKITFESIKLQAADSINSIAANVMAAIDASTTFLLTAFGPGSGIYTIIGAQFDVLAAKFTQSMIGGAKAIADALNIPFTHFDEALKQADRNIEQSQNKITNAIDQIGGDFVEAGKRAGESYDQALKSSKDLIDTSQMEVKLQEHRNELKKLEVEALAAAAKAAAEKLTVEEISVTVAKTRLTHEERLKEIDADIAQAKRLGNKAELGELESMKAFHVEMEESLRKGLTLQEAVTNANKARQNTIDNIVTLTKNEVKQTDSVKTNMIAIKTVGDLIARTKLAEPMKSFRERTNDAQKKVKEFADFLGGDFSRMSLFDLGKKLGIERTRNDAGKMLTAIEAKLKEISDQKLEIKIDENMTKEELVELQKKIAATKGQAEINLNADHSISGIREELKKEIDLSLGSSTGTTILEKISKAVDHIERLVAKIEPKLPTAALGI